MVEKKIVDLHIKEYRAGTWVLFSDKYPNTEFRMEACDLWEAFEVRIKDLLLAFKTYMNDKI